MDFFRLGTSIVMTVFTMWTACSYGEEPETAPPNIIFFLVDDQRNTALGVAGDPYAITPTIDRLAREGTRFTNAFVTTSICAASRASILTGLTERTHGYTFGAPPVPEAFIRTAYPALLRSAGYRTGFFGKFGIQMEGDAKEILFDDFGNRDRPYLKKQADGTVRHVDEINTEQAMAFLQSRDNDAPFCLSVSFSSTHAEDRDLENHFPPIEAMKDSMEEITFTPPRLSDPSIFDNQPDFLKTSLNRERYFWRWDTAEKYQKNIRGYYRLVAGVDVMIRQVLDTLEQTGQAQNTVIIYAADNGYYMGDRGFAGKWSHYEESLRIPLIIFDPRQPENMRHRILDPMVLNLDIPATMLDLAGVTIPDHYQGRSLMPWLNKGEVDGWRTDFFVEHRMVHPQLPTWEGIRDTRYVYARYDGESPAYEFLHDLKTDPDQLSNVVTNPAYRGILQRLRDRTDALRESYIAAQTMESRSP
ncbi:MAG: mucin-desulfating sulfatase [Candidatus Hydrogenedentota bacterium]|nr:MAG: mucin-desulfating sulfatase [Candidatus Hydrogenedentota bacterium]